MPEQNLKLKMEETPGVIRLQDIADNIFTGVRSGRDSVFIINEKHIADMKLEKEIIHPVLRERDVYKYYAGWLETYLIYPYDNDMNKVIPEDALKDKYPGIYKYFLDNRSNLTGRDDFDESVKNWYELCSEKKLNNFKRKKITASLTSKGNRFCIDEIGLPGNAETLHIVLNKEWEHEYLYVLGLMNSRLFDFYHKLILVNHSGGIEDSAQLLRLYPIIKVDFSAKSQKSVYERLIFYIKQMLEARKEFNTAKNDSDRLVWQHRVVILDSEINSLVYELYDLRVGEMKMVERSVL